VVLFFYADWCPSCRIVDINYRIQASVAPTDVLIMRVEYDNRRDLVRHYGVTSQDSFVYINKDGSVRGRQIGGLYSLVDIVQRIE
jgi:thiol:disulfide interchange protein